jgi:hypothetical protein
MKMMFLLAVKDAHSQTKIVKLTQKQIDNIGAAAYDLKEAMSTASSRLNGHGVYVGEETVDVFEKCIDLNGAPKNKVKQLRKTLNQIESLLNSAECLAEDIEHWADDEEP